MTITFDKDDLNDGHGLEIGVRGFVDNPANAFDYPAQIYIEVYEGKLCVHVWNDKSEDPQTITVEPLAGA